MDCSGQSQNLRPCDGFIERAAGSVDARHIKTSLAFEKGHDALRHDILPVRGFEREGPMNALPGELWRLLAAYIWTSEAMSLRCTGKTAAVHLKVMADALFAGCRIIVDATRRESLQTRCPPSLMAELLTLPLGVRCDMFRRYALQVGSLRRVPLGKGGVSRAESPSEMRERYYKTKEGGPETEGAQSVQCWRHAVDMTKAALLEAAVDSSVYVALTDLYLAEMYAPLLGVVPDPQDHTLRVMAEASATFSSPYWTDFLFRLNRISASCACVETAQQTLLEKFDCRSPKPRAAILVSMIRASMEVEHLVTVREQCLYRIGIPPRFLAEVILPRVADSLVRSALAVLVNLRSYAGVRQALRLRIQRWGNDDGMFAAYLHRSLLARVKVRKGDGTSRYSGLSDAVRVTLGMRALDVAPGICKLFGLEASRLFDFWELHFDLTFPQGPVLSSERISQIDALPWPLRALLWRLVADIHADPHGTFDGTATPAIGPPSAESVKALCAEALADGYPEFAIPALLAALKWEVTLARADPWGSVSWKTFFKTHGIMGYRLSHLACMQLASKILNACTVAQRLPFIAALFGYRDLLTKCGYEWNFDALISADIGAFLCEPTSCLNGPSDEIVNVVLHYLPLYRVRLPECRLAPEACAMALADRFDLSATSLNRAISHQCA